MTCLLPKINILLKLTRNWWKIKIKTFAVFSFFSWKLQFASNILWMIVFGSIFWFQLANTFKLDFLDNFGNSKPFTLFKLTIWSIKLQKSANFPLLGSCFPIYLLRSTFGTKTISSSFYDVVDKEKVKSSQNITAFNIWSC